MWAAFKLLPLGTKIGIAVGMLLSLAAFIGGTYYVAYNKGLNVSAVKIEQYKTEKAQLETKLRTAQGKVTEKRVVEFVEKTNVVTKVVTKNNDIIREVIPEQFKFSKGWVYAYNQSIQGKEIDPELASNDEASTITDRLGLGYISSNNGICLFNKQLADSLQLWVKEQNEVSENIANR